MFNAVGQPISPQGITIPPTKTNKLPVDINLGTLNGGFDHFVFDLPQEDAYFEGPFKCKMTESAFPGGDDTQKAVVKTYDLDRINDDSQPYVADAAHPCSAEVIFSYPEMLAGANYTIACPDSYITKSINGTMNGWSNTNYNKTLVYFYAYNNDHDDIYSPRYYLSGSTFIEVTAPPQPKKHFWLWVIIGGIVALAVLLALFALWVRARKQQANSNDNYLFQALNEDEGHIVQ